MKYCRNCFRINKDDNQEKCKNCKKTKLTKKVTQEDLIYLTDAAGFELERITATLDDYNIKYITRAERYRFSEDSITGTNNIAGSEVLISYQDFLKAQDIMVGIGALKDEDVILPDLICESGAEAEKENQKSSKWLSVVTIIIFFAVVFMAVKGVDFIVELIKGLFK